MYFDILRLTLHNNINYNNLNEYNKIKVLGSVWKDIGFKIFIKDYNIEFP